MTKLSPSTRLFAAFALSAAGAMLVAAPAVAKSKPAIRITANTFKSPDAKLCMPKAALGANAAKDMPGTLCLTQDEWTAQGVNFVVK